MSAPPLEELRWLLNAQWRPFLTVIGPSQQARYGFNHATLREFFNGQVERESLLGEIALVDELAAATSNAHHRLADRYLQAWGDLAEGLPGLQTAAQRDLDDGYGLRHLMTHLVASGRTEEMHRLLVLETKEQRNVWYEAKEAAGDTVGYLADVTRAWQDAEKEYTNHQSPISIGRQCRYALITASLSGMAQNIPPSLLVALVKEGLRSPA
jgi:hypothetical protein